MGMKINKVLSLIIMVFVINNCITFYPIETVEPFSMWYTPRVNSLRPTFVWSPISSGKVCYDLAIWESVENKRIKGRMIYYQECITNNKHQIETELRPNRYYYWSVRIRDGEKASQWSTYSSYYFFAAVSNFTPLFRTQK